MRVLLVGPDLESNLSLRYLASSLRAAGHEPAIATFDSAADAPAVLEKARGAGLIGLSMCFQVRAPEFLALARALKADQPARPVIAGGHFASCAASELLADFPELDLIVVHEGERAIVELAELGSRLEGAERLAGVALRREGRPHLTPPRPILEDLDRLPAPDRSGPARLLAGVPTAYLMGSRGCVSACDYCCIATLHRLAPGKRFRQRTPERVVDEMAALYHRHGVRQFVFHDDNFLVPSYSHNLERLDGFERALRCQGLCDIGLVLKCSPRDADRRILARLQRMGLVRIFMGIESGTQCGLDAIGRRQTVEEAERAMIVCEELGVSSQYTLIIFHPEATPESMLADLDFAARHPAHPMNYCRAEIYAGTPLEARMVAAGRAEGDYLARTYRYTDPRVERIWELGRDLFAGRCWGQDEILGQAIRLDHQLTVVRHFYEGADAVELHAGFRAWQLKLNLGTAALFRELVSACADPASTGAARSRVLADLTRRERSSRDELRARLCAIRAGVDEITRGALPAAFRPSQAAPRARPVRATPRHAAAVAVALGLAAGYEAVAADPAPEPAKRRKADAGRPDAGAVPVPARPWHEEPGVAEAAPPPLDEAWRKDLEWREVPPPPADAGHPPGKKVPLPHWRDDHGVAEAAPPPYDDRYRRVRPPPPPPPAPAPAHGWLNVRVVANPGLPVTLEGVGAVRDRLPDRLPQALHFTVGNQSSGQWDLTLRYELSPEGEVSFLAESRPWLDVFVDGRKAGVTPLKTPRRPQGHTTIAFEDPGAKRRFEVRFDFRR